VFKRKSWLVFLAVIWIIIFAAAPLRSRLILMWRGGPQTRFTVVPSSYPENFRPMLAAQNPRSAALQFISIATRKSTFNPADLSAIDQLIEKYPDTAWLPALRLRITLAVFTTNRLGGELSDPYFPDNLKAGKPSPEISSAVKRNFSNSDLAAALKICALGEKREPQNSYYNWIESCLYWMSWQDDKARQALREGAAKSEWNSHLRDFYIATEQGYSQAVRRPLLAQEKIWIINAAPIFEALERYREDARIIIWSAIKDRRAGNNARALQTLSDTHHLMYLAGRSSNYPTNYLVANAIMANVEDGAYRPSRKVLLELSKKPMTRHDRDRGLRYLMALAKSQHRPELAEQIGNEGKERIKTLQKLGAQYGQNYSGEQFEHRAITYFTTGYLSVILLLSLLGTIALFILVTAGASSLRGETPHAREIISGALLGSGALAAICAFVLFEITAFITNIGVAAWRITVEALLTFILLFFIFVLGKSVLGLFHSARSGKRRYWRSIIGALVSIGVIAFVVATGPSIILWLNSRFTPDPFATIPPHGIDVFSYIQDFYFYLNMHGSPAGYLWRILIAMTPVVFGGVFLISQSLKRQKQLTAPESQVVTFQSKMWSFAKGLLQLIFQVALLGFWGLAILMALGLYVELQLTWLEIFVLLIVLLLAACRLWWRKPHRRASAQYGLHLFSRSLRLWMCIASCGILAMLLIQLSVSKPLQQVADSQLYGDMPSF
jgi:hypothetical protein